MDARASGPTKASKEKSILIFQSNAIERLVRKTNGAASSLEEDSSWEILPTSLISLLSHPIVSWRWARSGTIFKQQPAIGNSSRRSGVGLIGIPWAIRHGDTAGMVCDGEGQLEAGDNDDATVDSSLRQMWWEAVGIHQVTDCVSYVKVGTGTEQLPALGVERSGPVIGGESAKEGRKKADVGSTAGRRDLTRVPIYT